MCVGLASVIGFGAVIFACFQGYAVVALLFLAFSTDIIIEGRGIGWGAMGAKWVLLPTLSCAYRLLNTCLASSIIVCKR